MLLVYRHPVKAFIPLLPIALIVGWSGGAMYLLDIKYTPLTATLGALIIGIGTEFTILIMERFYEERRKGRNSREAIMITNRKTGKAILASAFTTIGGFSALLISDFVILSNFGLMTLINISLALFSSIAVMPAILIILDRFVKIRHVGENELPVK
ncbi:MMPL family transporter [Mesobacillus boroniphilus]|nr:MMPL family transporter [Mesobacillus boroniphilus]